MRGGKVTMVDMERRRWKGRPKRRWMDSENVELREKGPSGEEMQDRKHRPHMSEVGKYAVEEEEEEEADIRTIRLRAWSTNGNINGMVHKWEHKWHGPQMGT